MLVALFLGQNPFFTYKRKLKKKDDVSFSGDLFIKLYISVQSIKHAVKLLRPSWFVQYYSTMTNNTLMLNSFGMQFF